jgi:hypothetical protein
VVKLLNSRVRHTCTRIKLDTNFKNHLSETRNIGTRFKGRPRKRWIEDIEEDIQIKGIRGWRKLCKERGEWRRITETQTNSDSQSTAKTVPARQNSMNLKLHIYLLYQDTTGLQHRMF